MKKYLTLKNLKKITISIGFAATFISINHEHGNFWLIYVESSPFSDTPEGYALSRDLTFLINWWLPFLFIKLIEKLKS